MIGWVHLTAAMNDDLVITGTIQNCSNANVTSGTAVVYVVGGNTYSAPVNNGVFTLTVLSCSNTLNFTVLPIDFTTMQQGAPATGSGSSGTVNVGTLQACGTSAQEFIEILIDGVPNNFVSPPDDIMTFDSAAPSNSTTIYATGNGNTPNTARYFSMHFTNNGNTGTFPISSCYMSFGTAGGAQQIVSTSPTVTITTFGPPNTGFIEGNFSVVMNVSGTNRTVSSTFRVRR